MALLLLMYADGAVTIGQWTCRDLVLSTITFCYVVTHYTVSSAVLHGFDCYHVYAASLPVH
jgi:hypothetical protein